MTDSSRSGQPGALVGLLFPLIFLVGMVLSGLTGPGSPPQPSAADADVVRYYTEGGASLLPGALVQALSALALLWFAPLLAAYVDRGQGRAMAGLVQAAGAVAAAFTLLSVLAQWVLSRPSIATQVATTRAMADVSFIAGGVMHVVCFGLLIGAASAVARTTGALPAWATIFGLVVSAIALLSVFSLMVDALMVLLPAGRFLGFIWLIVASVLLSRGRQPARV